MRTIARFHCEPRPCSYLPGEVATIEYEVVARMEPIEYQRRLDQGWRRFGRTLFRPRCRSCASCRSLRVAVPDFQERRTFRRVRARNRDVRLQVRPARGRPDADALDLSRRFHHRQAERVGWPSGRDDDADGFRDSFLDHPFPTEAWRFLLGDRLVGLGFVDVLPGGLSAIYFVHDLDHGDRSLGTWNILCLIDRAAAEGLPFVYLGYWVEGCRSLSYKKRFRPSELLGTDGRWRAGPD